MMKVEHGEYARESNFQEQSSGGNQKDAKVILLHGSRHNELKL